MILCQYWVKRDSGPQVHCGEEATHRNDRHLPVCDMHVAKILRDTRGKSKCTPLTEVLVREKSSLPLTPPASADTVQMNSTSVDPAITHHAAPNDVTLGFLEQLRRFRESNQP